MPKTLFVIKDSNVKNYMRLFFPFFFLISFACAEEVIPNICWFDTPPNCKKQIEGSDPGDNPFSMESKVVSFIPKDKNINQMINISLITVGESIGNGKVITMHPVSDEQLKMAFISATTTNVAETTLANQRALKVRFFEGGKYNDVFWVRVRPNKVLQVNLTGDTEPLLDSTYPWLSSLKIKSLDHPDPPPAIALAGDNTQLNMSRDEIIKSSLNVFSQSGPDVVLITKNYQIIVNFFSGLEGKSNIITYCKITDPPSVAASMHGDPSISQDGLFLPLAEKEVQDIIGRQTEGGKFTWRKARNNFWERSDGAAATLQHGMLTLASKDELPDLSWFPK